MYQIKKFSISSHSLYPVNVRWYCYKAFIDFLCMFYVELVCFYAEFFKIFDLLPVFLYALHNCLKSKIINSGYFK